MSNEHQTSNMMWMSYLNMKKMGNIFVVSLVNYKHLKLAKENIIIIKIIGRVLLYTALLDITQRDDNEGENSLNRSNYIELLDLIEEFNDYLNKK